VGFAPLESIVILSLPLRFGGGAMADIEIGYFGDERLKKGARICRDVLLSGRQAVSANWQTDEPSRFASAGS
jgi:hypothetical protein